MAGSKQFTHLDLRLDLLLDNESKDYTVINTHRGLFRYNNHLPFGVSSAPGIFQRAMETLLQGIQNVAVYIDDILVTGTMKEVHQNTLNEVLNRLEEKQVSFYVTISGTCRAQNQCSGSASLTGEGEDY